jgi:C4-dicarboxylate-specific signal transduction histidine kinase
LMLLALYSRQRQHALAFERTAKTELELRVDERTRDLVAANEQLQREVSERERTEQTLRETQDGLVHAGKLAVLGQMAAGLSHELNQPLTALRGLSDNAVKLLDRGLMSEARANLEMIAGIVMRTARLTGQLKVFAYKAPKRAEPVRVERSVGDALVILHRRIREQGVKVTERYAARDPEFVGDSARFQQVLVNLLANALDALRDQRDGRIEIGTSGVGGNLRITVRDNGPGICPDALQRLFDPFFTTKEAGVGLGLGLTISGGIVRDFGGTLRASTPPEGGAEFAIELPEHSGNGIA